MVETPRIMHLITNFAARGGAETMLARLVTASSGSPPVIVSLREISSDNRGLVGREDVEFIALGARSAPGLVAAAGQVGRLLRERRPAALVCWMYHAHVVGALGARSASFKGGVFWNIRSSLDPDAYLELSTRLAILAGSAMRSTAHGMIFNSERAVANHAIRGYLHQNTVVLPNGYVLPAKPDLSPRPPKVFGIAARFHPEKDYETFLAAAQIVLRERPNSRLVIVGRGAVEDNPNFKLLLDRFTIDRGRTTLMDEITDMSAFYRAIDVNVLSSRMEGFPNVIAEAMSYGAPCISTDVGDASFIIGGAGRTSPARNPEALAAGILDLLGMSAKEHAGLRTAARARIEENFEIGGVARRYRDFIFGGAA